jgi:hypothetical protein
MAKDGGAGASSKQPESSTMKFYESVMKGIPCDERGNAINVGGESAHLCGAGGGAGGDPTSKQKKYENEASKAKGKGPDYVVSKRVGKKG